MLVNKSLVQKMFAYKFLVKKCWSKVLVLCLIVKFETTPDGWVASSNALIFNPDYFAELGKNCQTSWY